MNILKATVATAAAITCCMGNEYPAQAQAHHALHDAGFETGHQYGVIVSSCFWYYHDTIDHNAMKLVSTLLAEREDEVATKIFNALRDEYYEAKNPVVAKCFPVVNSAFNAIQIS